MNCIDNSNNIVNENSWDKQLLNDFQVINVKTVNNKYIFQIPTGYPVLNFIENFPLFKKTTFSKSTTKRYLNKKYVIVKVGY